MLTMTAQMLKGPCKRSLILSRAAALRHATAGLGCRLVQARWLLL